MQMNLYDGKRVSSLNIFRYHHLSSWSLGYPLAIKLNETRLRIRKSNNVR